MIQRPTNIYACNGRERETKPYLVQDGYHEWKQGDEVVRGKPKYISIKSEFQKGCKYDASHKDQKCTGCAHRQQP